MNVKVIWEEGIGPQGNTRYPVELEEVSQGIFELPSSCFSGWVLMVTYKQIVGMEETFSHVFKNEIVDLFPTQGEAVELENALLDNLEADPPYLDYLDRRYSKSWSSEGNVFVDTEIIELYVL